ncbi:MAG TPA: glutamate--cysteine ligase [Rhodospirillaceae bacterium]|nr:glutamate--cysteine ligase [Candidatus Neomarinimicrobiota bacterium]HCX14931.1 glutamate--cysteine ligase [Rhodospirillaceae bacterium]
MKPFRSDKADLVTSKAQLVATLESGCKPKDLWRIGTEHEKFPYDKVDFKPLSYEGAAGIRAFLEGMQRFGWEPVTEGDNLIALKQADKGSITLEPGGQVELSGAPLEDVHQTCNEVMEHLSQVKDVSDDLGIGMLGLGFTPDWRQEDIHWMPKGRYKIMRNYMPKVGDMGIDMMTRTCTVQVNLDYASEADMVKKLRVSLALQPVATALWANSPFTEGKPNGFLSHRANTWLHTDADRTGQLPFVFEDGMGFERYVDYLLDVPMYFVYRNGYMDVSGQSFRKYMDGTMPALPGEVPTIADWFDHMSTAFPEVRIKNYIELRGADAGPWGRLCGLPAFWAGLLYDTEVLDGAWDLVKGWTVEDREQLYRDVPSEALEARIKGRSIQEVAKVVLDLSEAGLKKRARLDKEGNDETGFLRPLKRIADTGVTPAERMLDLFHGPWDGDVSNSYIEFSY